MEVVIEFYENEMAIMLLSLVLDTHSVSLM